jgi:DNA uptake protein ComE-like DNA-binding protein
MEGQRQAGGDAMTVTEKTRPTDIHDVEPGVGRKRSVAAEFGKLVVFAGVLAGLLFTLFDWGQSIAAERVAGLEGQVSFLSQQLDLAEEVTTLTQQRDLLNSEIRQLQQRIVDPQSELEAPPTELSVVPSGCEAGQIDMNAADVDQLQQIVHIGEMRAPEIVRQRPFESVADLERVSGIGPVYIGDIVEQGIACVAN